jgi:hypothetical protein
MLRIHSALKSAACLTGLSLCLVASGCGGGVDSEADVVLKPSEPSAASGTTGTNGNATTPAANGADTAAPAGGYGVLRGRVVYTGSVPKQGVKFAVGKASADPNWCAASSPILDQKVVIDETTKGIANVFLWLEDMPEGGKETAEHESGWQYKFDQMNCTFVPHAMVLRTGKPLTIHSSDRVKHNVNVGALRNLAFNQSMSFGEELTHVFERQEPVPILVKCDIHTWMNAYQLPIAHPYAAVTNEKGEFQITDLPVGEHEFKIWHEANDKLRGGRLTVVIDPGDNEKTIEVGPSDLQAGLNTPQSGSVLLSRRDAAGR